MQYAGKLKPKVYPSFQIFLNEVGNQYSAIMEKSAIHLCCHLKWQVQSIMSIHRKKEEYTIWGNEKGKWRNEKQFMKGAYAGSQSPKHMWWTLTESCRQNERESFSLSGQCARWSSKISSSSLTWEIDFLVGLM